MEQKNKFDTFDKPDEFDKMLFDYYDKNNEKIPLSTQNAIENAFKDKHKEKSTTIIMLKRVAVFILCIGIVTATTVYAKDIINFITSIFTNSTPGIDKAVDNGYVQNVDMDFITYNDVGVKVDYLLMDDKNLDISFVYKYYDESAPIDSITFSNLTIKDEQNNLLCFMSDNSSDLTGINNIIGASVKSVTKPIFIDNTTVRESILASSEKFPNSQELYIEITNMALTMNNEIKYIDGNWSFSINIDDKLVTRNSYEFSSTDNPYIDNIKTSITATSLSIELQLNTLFDEATLYTRNAITLKDENNNTYRPTKMLSKNINTSEPYSSTITLLYPISAYDNINKLYLHINLDSDKKIDLELSK